MANYFEAYKKTMRHEGGYVDDPADAGGETFMGISRKFNRDWKGWSVIDAMCVDKSQHFPLCLSQSQRLLNLVQLFYKERYWNIFNGDEIKDQAIAEEMFDTGINVGTHRAILFLQQGLNYLNRNGEIFDDLVEDGAFGAKTMEAFFKLSVKTTDIDLLIKIMNVLQGMHYLDYMKKSPVQEKYCRGWFKRVNISK